MRKTIKNIITIMLLCALGVIVCAVPAACSRSEESHAPVYVAAVEPTCTEAGHLPYWQCTDCDKIFLNEAGTAEINADAVLLPARNHDCIIGTEGGEPTCINDGATDEIRCRVCGTVLLEQRPLPALGHRYGQWRDVTPADCTHGGERVRNCEICKAEDKEDVPALGHKYVLVGAVEPTFDSVGYTECVKCEACGLYLIDPQEIPKLNESDYAYKIVFECDGGADVAVYASQQYTDPVLSAVAYSRDGKTGELVKDGSGQVNFELKVADGYSVGQIHISGSYKNLKLPDSADVARVNTYRITKISSDLTVSISTVAVPPLRDLAAYNDTGSDEIRFSWRSSPQADGYSVTVRNCSTGSETEYSLAGDAHSFTFEHAADRTRYEFVFEPRSISGRELSEYAVGCSRFFCKDTEDMAFPKVVITTKDNVLPTCRYIDPPEGLWGKGITDNEYVRSSVTITDTQNAVVFDSDGASNDFSGAKIKIRGNGSAYEDKKPYKLKLTKSADLLRQFVSRDDGIDYSSKEWLLLAMSVTELKQTVGWSISELLRLDYTPAYTYVSLFINGDYCGLYLLCESVCRGNGSGQSRSRCNVDDDGYIIELDAYWWNEDLYFSTSHTENINVKYTFKYPDSDDISETSAQYAYIRDYVERAERAVFSGSGNIADYADLTSLAKWLLAHDLIATADAGGSNIYLIKADSSQNSKLKMVVLWDMDAALKPDKIGSFASIHNFYTFWFRELLKTNEFYSIYRSLFAQYKGSVVAAVESGINRIDQAAYDSAMGLESARWGSQEQTLENRRAYIIGWLNSHISRLERAIA